MHFERLQAQYAVNCLQVACLALTFDDGPNRNTTPQILSELEAAHVPATFFLIGKHIAGNEGLVARMYGDGYEIGNHTWSHPDLSKLSVDQVRQEVNEGQTAILSAGGPLPRLFRPPYESMTLEQEQVVPLRIVLWNEDPKDWHVGITAPQVVQAVEASAHPGGIVDMHDIYHTTADALPQILTDLQSRGFHFVTVSQLLAMDPDNDHVFYGFKAQQ
jgi:peptidoglycan/xylan/chitin deacetylase (PgdA/CDA1 family)